jgi:hypothetical protein
LESTADGHDGACSAKTTFDQRSAAGIARTDETENCEGIESGEFHVGPRLDATVLANLDGNATRRRPNGVPGSVPLSGSKAYQWSVEEFMTDQFPKDVS